MLWTRAEGMLDLGGPCVTGRRVVWGDNGVLMCRDADSGDHLWRIRLPARESCPPAAAAGRLYVLTQRELLAYE